MIYKERHFNSKTGGGIFFIILFIIITFPIMIISSLSFFENYDIKYLFYIGFSFLLLSYSLIEVFGRKIIINNIQIKYIAYFIFKKTIKIEEVVGYKILYNSKFYKPLRALLVNTGKKDVELNITPIISNKELKLLISLLDSIIDKKTY